MQVAYVNATSEPERRAVAVAFERAVRGMHEHGEQDDDAAARRAELDAILNAPPALISLDRIEALAERQERAQQAQWRYRDGEPVAAIAERLRIARSTVRRDLEWWWRTLAREGQREDDLATRAARKRAASFSSPSQQ